MKHVEEKGKGMSADMAEIQAEITQGQQTVTVVDIGESYAKVADILGGVEVVLTDCTDTPITQT